MPTMKLTQKAVDRLRAPDPSGKQVLLWDDKLKGFGVLVSGTTNAKSYVVQAALRDGTRRRVTVGRTNVLKLDAAITKAQEILALFYANKDPKHWLGAADPTLKGALDDYIDANKSLGTKSADDYRSFIETHLAGWLDTRLSAITTDMVRERHAKIAEEIAEKTKGQKVARTGHAAANATMRCFRAVYNYCRDRNKDLPENPVRGLKRSWFRVRRRTRLVKFDQRRRQPARDRPRPRRALQGRREDQRRRLAHFFTHRRSYDEISTVAYAGNSVAHGHGRFFTKRKGKSTHGETTHRAPMAARDPARRIPWDHEAHLGGLAQTG